MNHYLVKLNYYDEIQWTLSMIMTEITTIQIDYTPYWESKCTHGGMGAHLLGRWSQSAATGKGSLGGTGARLSGRWSQRSRHGRWAMWQPRSPPPREVELENDHDVGPHGGMGSHLSESGVLEMVCRCLTRSSGASYLCIEVTWCPRDRHLHAQAHLQCRIRVQFRLSAMPFCCGS
jgi:hypothetical protein